MYDQVLRMAIRSECQEEAKEYVSVLAQEKFPTTQDSYGRVMSFLSGIEDDSMKSGWLDAMVDNGYPQGTANSLRSILGISDV